jgi:hypothetical protein
LYVIQDIKILVCLKTFIQLKTGITCLHGSARQVVIGHVAFKGEGALFMIPQSPH